MMGVMAVNRAETEYQRDPLRLVDLLFFDCIRFALPTFGGINQQIEGRAHSSQVMSLFHRAVLNRIIHHIQKIRLGRRIPDHSVLHGFQQSAPRKQ